MGGYDWRPRLCEVLRALPDWHSMFRHVSMETPSWPLGDRRSDRRVPPTNLGQFYGTTSSGPGRRAVSVALLVMAALPRHLGQPWPASAIAGRSCLSDYFRRRVRDGVRNAAQFLRFLILRSNFGTSTPRDFPAHAWICLKNGPARTGPLRGSRRNSRMMAPRSSRPWRRFNRFAEEGVDQTSVAHLSRGSRHDDGGQLAKISTLVRGQGSYFGLRRQLLSVGVTQAGLLTNLRAGDSRPWRAHSVVPLPIGQLRGGRSTSRWVPERALESQSGGPAGFRAGRHAAPAEVRETCPNPVHDAGGRFRDGGVGVREGQEQLGAFLTSGPRRHEPLTPRTRLDAQGDWRSGPHGAPKCSRDGVERPRARDVPLSGLNEPVKAADASRRGGGGGKGGGGWGGGGGGGGGDRGVLAPRRVVTPLRQGLGSSAALAGLFRFLSPCDHGAPPDPRATPWPRTAQLRSAPHDASGPPGPREPILAPIMLPAVEDLATKIISHLDTTHGRTHLVRPDRFPGYAEGWFVIAFADELRQARGSLPTTSAGVHGPFAARGEEKNKKPGRRHPTAPGHVTPHLRRGSRRAAGRRQHPSSARFHACATARRKCVDSHYANEYPERPCVESWMVREQRSHLHVAPPVPSRRAELRSSTFRSLEEWGRTAGLSGPWPSPDQTTRESWRTSSTRRQFSKSPQHPRGLFETSSTARTPHSAPSASPPPVGGGEDEFEITAHVLRPRTQLSWIEGVLRGAAPERRTPGVSRSHLRFGVLLPVPVPQDSEEIRKNSLEMLPKTPSGSPPVIQIWKQEVTANCPALCGTARSSSSASGTRSSNVRWTLSTPCHGRVGPNGRSERHVPT